MLQKSCNTIRRDRDEQKREKEQIDMVLELLQSKIEGQIEQIKKEQDELIKEKVRQQEQTREMEKQIQQERSKQEEAGQALKEMQDEVKEQIGQIRLEQEKLAKIDEQWQKQTRGIRPNCERRTILENKVTKSSDKTF